MLRYFFIGRYATFLLQDGVLIENMFDLPYVTPKQAGPEQVAFMTRLCTEVKKFFPLVPCGVQILAGNNLGAVATAAAAGKMNVHLLC